MLRSAWLLSVGVVLTAWYACKLYVLAIFGAKKALCRACPRAGRDWSRRLLKLADVTVRVEGEEYLEGDGAAIIVANHESWFDVWALAGWLPIEPHFIAKHELSRIPIFGKAWQACGHISVDRANRESAIESLEKAGERIHDEGLRMVLFAKGTRSASGELQEFKKGPFVLAIQGGVPIVPVGILGTRPLMPKGSYRIGRGEIVVKVGEPISVAGMDHGDRDRLKEMVRSAIAGLRGGEGRTSNLSGEGSISAALESTSHD